MQLVLAFFHVGSFVLYNKQHPTLKGFAHSTGVDNGYYKWQKRNKTLECKRMQWLNGND